MLFVFSVIAAAAFVFWYLVVDTDLILFVCDRLFQGRRQRLRGMTVWITGASSGIGEYLAYELAPLGVKLILSARRREELERVRQSCITKYGSTDDSVKVLPLDVCDYESHSHAVAEALKLFGGHIDMLINNAGRSQRALVADTELGVDRELLETNTLGPISLTKAILPSMMQRKSGHIVVISSLAGKLGTPVSASYAASKHAVQGWFGTLRMEMLSDNISVSIMCPGPVTSQIGANAISKTVGSRIGPTNVGDSEKMSTKRCASLIVTSLACGLEESWISDNPFLLFCYFAQYSPNLASFFAKVVVPKRIAAFKAGDQDVNRSSSFWGSLKRKKGPSKAD